MFTWEAFYQQCSGPNATFKKNLAIGQYPVPDGNPKEGSKVGPGYQLVPSCGVGGGSESCVKD